VELFTFSERVIIMADQTTTNHKKVDETTALKERIRELEAIEAKYKQAEVRLKQLEWMLSGDAPSTDAGQTNDHDQGYGDLTELNRDGVILTAIGRERLESFSKDYLDLLGTSAAIYEINGDYAFGIFSSGWCRMMDRASRRLCNTSDNVEALSSGRWLCHESCWTNCSEKAIAECAPVDIACNGGIRLYAVPVIAGGNVVGAINFGYGDPPKDPKILRKLADRYHIKYDDLVREADAYGSRPPFIIELAKKRLHATSRLIGSMIEAKQAEKALQESEEKYKTLAEKSIAGVYVIQDDTFRFVNSQMAIISGYAREELLGQSADLLINPEDLEKVRQNARVMMHDDVSQPYDFRIVTKQGEIRWVMDKVARIIYEGRPAILGNSMDITERKRAEDTIHQMAYHDSLTGLPNRKLFSDRLGIALARAKRDQKDVAVIMLDLDHFKDVNDTLGHDAGDILLKAAAKRLNKLLRKSDTVARFGGDEFILILPDLKGKEDVISVAQKIVENFRTPFFIDTHQLTLTTSIGIAVYPHDGTDEAILTKNADIAMYQAKQAGRDRYQIYKEG
jgi:diguanylate cyclase (GGDEF)-like protein/PAS domain S-box-containing protein